jgi:cellulose synthase/poly-beta-1,6-N-acetylglucosamine synthase-like glycosyltransferase
MQQQRAGITRLEPIDRTNPGELMTFGWAKVTPARHSRQPTRYCFVAMLTYSRMRFATITLRADTPTLLRCLMAAFEFFGGVPRAVSTTQALGGVWRVSDSASQWRPLIAHFTTSLGVTFQLRAPSECPGPPRSGEKGDRGAGIGSSGAKPARHIGGRHITRDSLNRQALAWCEQHNRRPHPATHQPPIQRLAVERLAPIRRERALRNTTARQGQFGAAPAAVVADPIRLATAESAAVAPAPSRDATATHEARRDIALLQPDHPRGAPAAADSVARQQLSARLAAEANHWEWWGAARDGARIVVTRAQKYILLLLIATILILLFTRPRSMLIACIALVTALYFVTGVYKIWLLVRGERANAELGRDVALAIEDELPIFTVLVPLHREGRILPVLVERLKSIDYPPDRLQVLLLIEMDDEETQNAARRCSLPAHISPMIMPPGQPRTKPRALNIGLHEARGKYIVIYDAEDRPEHDQLRKAVAAFQALPDDVVCVQGRLNFYNRRQSLLTRLFAVDYAVWYDQFLPGLALAGLWRSGAFVPLGGTSNHFRVETLRQVGGWDPFNVTEDCDLGARLGRAGLRVAMLDSSTWEEAVPRVRPWIKQRSRWIKGYLQTYLVHMRHPLLLVRQLGLRGFVDFQMLVGASCLVVLINPLMWALMGLYMVGAWTPLDKYIEMLFPAPLYYPALLSLVVGNFIFFSCNVYTCVRHGYLDLTRYALLTPVYWILMSFGAWRGLISLIRNPFYWAKTEHGVSLPQTEGSATDQTYAA